MSCKRGIGPAFFLTCYCFSPRVVVGYANGRVTLMDYEKKEQIAGVVLPRGLAAGDAVTCLRFSPQCM